MSRHLSRPGPPYHASQSSAVVCLWDSAQRRFTVARADSRGLELVGPANVVSEGSELVLGIGYARGDIFLCLRVMAVAAGRTDPGVARIRAHWRNVWGSDQALTRRFLTERLNVSTEVLRYVLALPNRAGQDQLTPRVEPRRSTSRRFDADAKPASQRLHRPRTLRNPYRLRAKTTSGPAPVRRNTHP